MFYTCTHLPCCLQTHPNARLDVHVLAANRLLQQLMLVLALWSPTASLQPRAQRVGVRTPLLVS
jgi:hypothetical protein